MDYVGKLLFAQVGSFHFENSINLTNHDTNQAIADQYHVISTEIEYDKLRTLSRNFYDSNSDTSVFYLFKNALKYANSQTEAYLDIKNIMFGIVNYFERIVIYFNKIMISLEVIVVNFMSFYKCLMQDYDYENVAFDILKSLDNDQTNGIFKPLGQIAEQAQSVTSTIKMYRNILFFKNCFNQVTFQNCKSQCNLYNIP